MLVFLIVLLAAVAQSCVLVGPYLQRVVVSLESALSLDVLL